MDNNDPNQEVDHIVNGVYNQYFLIKYRFFFIAAQYPLKPNPAPVNHPKPVTAKPVSANKPNSGGSGILGTGIGSGSVISSIVNSGSGSLPNIASITGPNFNPVSGIVRPGHSGNPNTGIVSGVNPLLPIINKPNAGKPWSQSNDGQE
jgi:hypothetical protein